MAITLQPSDLIFEFASNGMDDIHQVQPPEHRAQSASTDDQIDTDRQADSQLVGWLASQQILIKHLLGSGHWAHLLARLCQLATHKASQ